MTRRTAAHHAEWLSLLEISGPFLSLPVLARALPQGLEADDAERARELRIAFGEFKDDPGLQARWVRWVLTRVLDYPDESLLEAGAIPASLSHRVAEHGITLRPELAVSQGEHMWLLVDVWPADQSLDARIPGESWTASPRERTAELLRATDVRVGIATNGCEWTLVNAKPGESTGYATWDAELWLEERITLRALRTVVGVERTLGAPEGEALADLLDQSAEAQHEVTDQLGKQVRFAIELLISSLDRADRERHGELLGEVSNEELYLAAVTVMMRLVFLFTAEERGLLPLTDPLYAESYAASTLRAQLQEEADRHSEDPLERRSSAWHRLLATFRAVHAGIEHDRLRLPAYGGALFDPDRFPFLEGRTAETTWERASADPLPLDDRTLLHILDALQMLRTGGAGSGSIEAQRLSYRSLDVEQIGHVYEGLLDHTAVRTFDPALGFEGKLEPEIALAEVERQRERDEEDFCAWLAKETGRSASAIAKRLGVEPDADARARLLAACGGDEELLERVLTYQALLRADLRGYPLVFLSGSLYVTQAMERRSSGTYYTTRSLAEEVVKHALDPLAYDPGPAEETNPEQWKLKSPAALLELKVCDMAMGSGAFLVAACRYLAARLIESWEGLGEGSFTTEGEPATGAPGELTVPADPEEQMILARRLVADRCLYGVDKNPMAVDMAKLSLWLITMARERPFNFLDHALRTGDSLLGITDLRQIEHFHIDPRRGAELHGTFFDYTAACGEAVEEALRKRQELEAFPALDVRDAERKERLHREASEALETARLLGDLVIGAVLAAADQGADALDSPLASVEEKVGAFLEPARSEDERAVAGTQLRDQADAWLTAGRPPMSPEHRSFHWPLELPEVFLADGCEGFDAVVGNPPFLGGVALARTFGETYERLLKRLVPESRGFVDLAAYFHRRAHLLIPLTGIVGLLGPQNLVNSANRTASTNALLSRGRRIGWARRKVKWPGTASLYVCVLLYVPLAWSVKPVLDGRTVTALSSSLDEEIDVSRVRRLRPWVRYSQGTDLYGGSFVKSVTEWEEFVQQQPAVATYLRPYVNADILCSTPKSKCDLLAVDFGDRDKDELEAVSLVVAHLEESVGRERSRQTRQIHEHRPWLHWDKRRKAYELARRAKLVMACPRVSKHLPMLMVDSSVLVGKTVKFFPGAEYDVYALLQSEMFVTWAFTTSPLRGDGIEFSTRNSLDPFPPPELPSKDLECAGQELWERRKASMATRATGITDLLNLVHNKNVDDRDIVELRHCQVELDHTVAAAYRWDDLDLGHDFYETRQGIRYTFEPVVRTEILDRLLELNHERYDEEVRAGLHGKGTKGGGSRDRRGKRAQEALL